MTDIERSALVSAAFDARKNAYVPYSGFSVGAALLTGDNHVFLGCNIENSAYGPSNCAERTAFFKAISEGQREFTAIAVVGGPIGASEGEVALCPPCGVCRQVMAEFCKPDFEIITATSACDICVTPLSKLLPFAFTPKNLDGSDGK